MADQQRSHQSIRNKETLEWLKVTNANSSRKGLHAAKVFFGYFPGDHRSFTSWKNNFLNEHKSKKQDAQRSLMKFLGGTGKHGENPPEDYIPEDIACFKFVTTNQCNKCNMQIEDEDNLKSHIQKS